jgi:hypothetical protein
MWGYFTPEAWQGVSKHEVFIAGECLADGAELTFQTLLHEAVHAMAAARKVQDTSRAGRYHNLKFVALASELGMEHVASKPDAILGWSRVTLRPETVKRYEDTIAALGNALDHHALAAGERKKPPSRSNVKLTCPCGRIIRVSAAEREAGGLHCRLCDGAFSP